MIPDFEQNLCSRTAEGIYKIGRESIGYLIWLAYYDRSHYKNINSSNLLASVVTCRNEIS